MDTAPNSNADVPSNQSKIRDIRTASTGSCSVGTTTSEVEENDMKFAEPVNVDVSEVYIDLSDLSSENNSDLEDVSSVGSDRPTAEDDLDDVSSAASEKPLDQDDLDDVSSGPVEEGEITDDDDDDDVPSDFFDDFTKQDFLDGLDIVDAWEGNKPKPKPEKRKVKPAKERPKKRSRSRPRARNRSRSPPRDRKTRRYVRIRSSSRSRDRNIRRARSPSPYRPRVRKYRRRSYDSRSPSPRKYRRKEEITKRKSFLEEIRDKLNEVKSPVASVLPSNFNVHSSYLPVPPSPTAPPVPVNPLPPAPVPPPLYDQSFSIGTQTTTVDTKAAVGDSLENVTKLFAEKKISLSDYLSITAKPEVKPSDPGQLKVIKLCEEAIKVLSVGGKGRLIVQPSSEPESGSEVRHQSPLQRNQTKLQFTTLQNKPEIDNFSGALYDVLRKIEVLDEERDAHKLFDSIAEAFTSGVIDKKIKATILKISLLGAKSMSVKCGNKRRKEVGTQCFVTSNVSVQTSGGRANPGKRRS